MTKPLTRYTKCAHCMRYVLRTDVDHLCVRPTEAALTGQLKPELRDAYCKLRAFAEDLGPQKIYASPNAINFTRDVCYLYVRPRPSALEAHLFLSERITASIFSKVHEVAKLKFEHTCLLRHVDQVEEPLTDYLYAAWEYARR